MIMIITFAEWFVGFVGLVGLSGSIFFVILGLIAMGQSLVLDFCEWIRKD